MTLHDTAKKAKALSHYDVLGVPHDASAVTVKHAYHGLARRYHPDRAQHVAAATTASMTFLTIQDAYDTLTDPIQRHNYDLRLQRPAARDSRALTSRDVQWTCEDAMVVDDDDMNGAHGMTRVWAATWMCQCGTEVECVMEYDHVEGISPRLVDCDGCSLTYKRPEPPESMLRHAK